MITVLRYVLLFFFYSAAGWAVESTYCSLGEKRFINRGFLTGPMCPIYGTGALVMTLCMYNPFQDKPLMVFLLGMVLCDIVEYITSVLMETLFHARWWDYTYEFLNIRGRICLKHTLFWGIASVAFVYILHPGVDKVISSMSDTAIIIITSIVFVIFAVDAVHAFIKALDIRNLQIKLASVIESVNEGFNNVKNVIEDKYEVIQGGLEKSNDKINEVKSEIVTQVQDIVEQFELRFSKPSDKDGKNKYSSRYLRNNFNIEKYTRKQIDKLKSLSDDFKANFFENGDKQ